MTLGSPDDTTDRELTVPEMLADPIVRMVTARDGVETQDVEAMIRDLHDRMARRQIESRGTCRRERSTINREC